MTHARYAVLRWEHRTRKMYRDRKDGGASWVGYVARGQWFAAYRPAEVQA